MPADASAEFAWLEDWLFRTALPLWSTVGVDRARGGFVERLDPKGRPTEEPRRARVVGRQIFSFATAEALGWDGPARALVRHGLDELEARFFGPDGMVVSTAAAGGAALDRTFDLYDHAFVLFGLAAACRIGERPAELRDLAGGLRDRMTAGWAHPERGFEESRPRSLPLKANPHMHMLEASLAWIEAAPDDAWNALADEIVELCLDRFLTPGQGALREFFDGDWRAISHPDHDVVEPGHQFEWAWLLIRWGRLRGRPDALAAARRLIEIAEAHGVERDRRLAINALNPDLSPRDRLARLWPQTERIKAFLALATIAGTAAKRDAALATAAEAAAGLRGFLDHPVPGAWWEHIGTDGRPIEEPTRASSLYHVCCSSAALADAVRPDRAKVRIGAARI